MSREDNWKALADEADRVLIDALVRHAPDLVRAVADQVSAGRLKYEILADLEASGLPPIVLTACDALIDSLRPP